MGRRPTFFLLVREAVRLKSRRERFFCILRLKPSVVLLARIGRLVRPDPRVRGSRWSESVHLSAKKTPYKHPKGRRPTFGEIGRQYQGKRDPYQRGIY